MSGYFGIGVYRVKTEANIGTLWRSAQNFGASFLFTIGKRYKKQSSDTTIAHRNIPLYHYNSFEDFNAHRPMDCLLLAIEQAGGSVGLETFSHPKRAIYLLGAEDNGIPPFILEQVQRVVHINTPMCLNVAVAGSIVMYDRQTKGA